MLLNRLSRELHMTTTIFATAGTAPRAQDTLPVALGQRSTQRMVKDEVVFAPARDPYADLARASERLSQGKSVFFEVAVAAPAVTE